jgi:hypothetical protein
MTDVSHLRQNIQRDVRGGIVYLDRRPLKQFLRDHDYATLDAYVESIGFHGAGYDWQATNYFDAFKILIEILYLSLVSLGSSMPLSNAAMYAVEIIELFDSDAKCYTNWTSINGWTASITDATFERGVVYMDDEHIGLFWVTEED